MRQRLLLVEDDDPQARAIARGLGQAGFEVTIAKNGRRALEVFREFDFDVVVLDLLLPDVDGIEVCRKIRESSVVPVLMISGRGDTLDVVVALEVGADDYVTKPCPIPELVARINALKRRLGSRTNGRHLNVGPLRIDTEAFTVELNGSPLALSLTEFRLLVELAREAGRAVTREHLLKRVWQYDFLGDSRLVDMAVKRLREQIEPDPKEPRFVVTVRGVGYRLDLPEPAGTATDLYAYSRTLRNTCSALADDLESLRASGDAAVDALVDDLARLERLLHEFVGPSKSSTSSPSPAARHGDESVRPDGQESGRRAS